MSQSWDIFKTVNEFSRFSDTKAGVVIAFAGGSAAFLSTKIDVLHSVIVQHGSDWWGTALYWAVLGYVAALLVTVVSALKSIWPSMGNGEKRSLIYFQHVAEDFGTDHAKYAEVLHALDDKAFEAELAHQICANSVIARTKFLWVGRAVRGLVWVITLWAVIMVFVLLLGAGLQRG